MHRIRKYLLIALFGIGLQGAVLAQDATHLVLDSNLPEATVYADSVWLGPARLSHFVIPSGTQTIRLVPEAADSWSIQPLIVTLEDEVQDTLTLTLNFPYHYKVESIPFGKNVYHERDGQSSYLGKTPLLYEAEHVLEGELVIRDQGYEEVRLTAGEMVWNRHVVALNPILDDPMGIAPELALQSSKGSKKWIDYLAVGTALSAGALAVHFKLQADKKFDEYEETGDPALRSEIEQLDTYSAISLGAMQVGIGVFAIRLVLK